MRAWHLITYDIRDDARLRRVARLMEGHGERLQYSVFRCRLSATELERLRWELARVVAAEDEVLIVPICGRCAGSVQGLYAKHRWDEDRPSFTVI